MNDYAHLRLHTADARNSGRRGVRAMPRQPRRRYRRRDRQVVAGAVAPSRFRLRRIRTILRPTPNG